MGNLDRLPLKNATNYIQVVFLKVSRSRDTGSPSFAEFCFSMEEYAPQDPPGPLILYPKMYFEYRGRARPILSEKLLTEWH